MADGLHPQANWRWRGSSPKAATSCYPRDQARRYLDENVGALDVTVSADELTRIDELLPVGAVTGPRYADMSHLDQST